MLVVGNFVLVLADEDGGSHHMQDFHPGGLRVELRKLMGYAFEYSSNIQPRLSLFCMSIFSPN